MAVVWCLIACSSYYQCQLSLWRCVLRLWFHWLLGLGSRRRIICRVKFDLNPVLPLCHFLGSLARLGPGEFSTEHPLGFKTSFAHFDSLRLLVNLSHRHSFLALSLKCWLVLELRMILDKVHNSLLI